MVQGILKTLGTSIRGLHQAAYLLAALTLGSQVLALLRDRIFAGRFGAGETLDLYYAAFRIPDLLFALVASLVSAYVLIPRIAKIKGEDIRELISHAASFLLISGGFIALVLFALAPFVLSIVFPSLYASHADEFTMLMRILLIQPILLGISGIVGSVTQIKRRFMLYALSPVLYNLGIIAGAVFLYPSFGLVGIALGVIFGSVLHLLVHVPVLLEAKAFPRFTLPSARLMIPIVRDSVPRSLALALGAVTLLSLTALASTLGEGSVSVLTLALNLEAVPLSLIAASYATAAFPVLSEEAGGKHSAAFKATLAAAARHLIFWSSVATVLVIVLRAHIVRALLGTGGFDWNDTRLTAAILGVFTIALVAQGVVLLASRAFYAADRSWNPLLLQAAGLVCSLGLALLGLFLANDFPTFRYFVESLMRVEDVPHTGVLFIALGGAVGQLLMGALALITLNQVAPGVSRGLIRPMLEGIGAAIIGGAAAYGALTFMGNIAPLTTLLSVLAQGVTAGMVGLIAAAAVLVLLENKEFRDVFDALRRITSAKKNLAPQSEI
jgi:putative peptidoglycan lipid II flippase